jgi:hypothetical protein
MSGPFSEVTSYPSLDLRLYVSYEVAEVLFGKLAGFAFLVEHLVQVAHVVAKGFGGLGPFGDGEVWVFEFFVECGDDFPFHLD